MAFLEIKNVKLSGLAACVPQRIEENQSLALFKGDEAEKFIDSTGVERRRIAEPGVTSSDLCFHAAERLIADLGWSKEEIDCLIFVSQTPDYILPATACILQDRLKLNEECYSLDISLGCSGWIYGASVISALLQNGNLRKGLLLVGDTTLRINSPEDKSTWPLFGDGGSATAFEYEKDNDGLKFHLATDGSNYEAIIIPDGGHRNPFSPQSLVMENFEDGVKRCRLDTILDGMDVFAFGISKGPGTIMKLSSHFNIDLDEVDVFAFHQANLFLNEKIRKKLKLPADKVPYSLKNYGNTSCATIPITLATEWRDSLQNSKQRIIACAFGVGLSWGSVFFETNKIICPEIIEI